MLSKPSQKEWVKLQGGMYRMVMLVNKPLRERVTAPGLVSSSTETHPPLHYSCIHVLPLYGYHLMYQYLFPGSNTLPTAAVAADAFRVTTSLYAHVVSIMCSPVIRSMPSLVFYVSARSTTKSLKILSCPTARSVLQLALRTGSK